MISNITPKQKTVEELLREAMSLIPVYTREWTNYNQSDPGITTIENLTAYHTYQLASMDDLMDGARAKLLKLLGFTGGSVAPAKCAFSIISAEDRMKLLAGTKFSSGDIVFENEKTIDYTNLNLQSAFIVRGSSERDISHIAAKMTDSGVQLFSAKSDTESELYLYLDLMPTPNSDISFSFTVVFAEGERNPLSAEKDISFSELVWEYYTEKGWTEMAVSDETHGFMRSGLVTMRLPLENGEMFSGADDGYCIRMRAKKQEFDAMPRIRYIASNVFPVIQRDTKVTTMLFNGSGEDRQRISIRSALPLYGKLMVFCREEAESGAFYLYTEAGSGAAKGRHYTRRTAEDGRTVISFNANRYGYIPAHCENAVRIVCCTDDFDDKQTLGKLYGFDNQELETGIENISADSFEIMVKSKDKNGVDVYYPAKPETDGENMPYYTIDCESGKLTFVKPCFDEENEVMLSSCILCKGESGNIRFDETFVINRPESFPYLSFPASAFNPVSAHGGKNAVTTEELRQEFVRDINTPTTAVTRSDYEYIAKTTPALLIHKAKAYATGANTIDLVVKPRAQKGLPVLSDEYCDAIQYNIEQHRMITTKISLLSPNYVPLEVYGTIYVKKHYTNSRAAIEALLKSELDYVNSDRDFGETVDYGLLRSKLEQLDCVEQVSEFTLEAFSEHAVQKTGASVEMDHTALCYLRRINLDIQTRVGLR